MANLKNVLRPKYSKMNEPISFYDPPTTSCQDMVGLRTNDTSTDTGYPNKKYKFIRKLDDGSASTIHLGQNVDTGEKVIIKVISKRDEWRKELSILKEMASSNTGRILKYIDYFESQRNSYIVTEFCPGNDLFEHIDINVPYTEKESYMLLLEMCKCIKECHDKGIVHLDIKCENFMVRKDHLFSKENTDSGNAANLFLKTGNVVLIDFGHAEKNKVEEIRKLKIGFRYGTTFYLCPEGYEKVYSSASDIWSLGICLSLLLTSDYPFYGDEKEFMWNALQHNISLSREISERSKIILDLTLQADPDKRPDIDQLISMLEKGIVEK